MKDFGTVDASDARRQIGVSEGQFIKGSREKNIKKKNQVKRRQKIIGCLIHPLHIVSSERSHFAFGYLHIIQIAYLSGNENK